MCNKLCYGSNECCRVATDGVTEYCLVESQCMADPDWEVIVIPAVIGFFALVVLAVILYKWYKAESRPMQVTRFAQQ